MSIMGGLASLPDSKDRYSRGTWKWMQQQAKQDISTLEANGNFAAAGVIRRRYQIADDEVLPPPKRKKRRGGPGRKDPDAALPKREAISKDRRRK